MAVKPRNRRYILTINNEKMTDGELYDYIKELEHVKYFIFQRERGEKKGTEHIQLFIQFTIAILFTTIKKYFPTAHIEQVKGTNVQARDYCSKTDTRIGEVFEFGEFAEERARTDIKQFLELVKNGANDDDLELLFPMLYLKYYNTLPKLRLANDLKNMNNTRRMLEVTFIYGPEGTGKTSYVRDLEGDENCYFVDNYEKGPFDTYNGQNVLVLDEYDGQFDITSLNKYLDIYPLELPARYYNRVAKYTKVYIISNVSFDKLYYSIQKTKITQYNALKRRIHNFYFFGKTGKYVVVNNDYIPLENYI